MQKYIYSEFRENKKYFLFSLIISSLSMVPQLLFSPNYTHTILLLTILILLISISKFSKVLFAVFVIFINLTNIFIGHVALHWGYDIPDIKPRIEVAFFSPTYETSEYLTKYVDYRDFLLIFFVYFVFLLLYNLLRKFNHTYKLLRVVGMGVVTIILIAISLYKNPLKEIEPISIVNKCYVTFKAKRDYEKILQERKTLLNAVKIKKVAVEKLIYDKILVVVGESANKNHMSIYGYKIPTTPFLTSLQAKDSKQLYVFNAIAPTNQTRYSVPMDLTDAHVNDYSVSFSRSCAIVTKFKVNNYETYWISNQGQVGKNDSTISSMAQESNHAFFLNIRYNTATTDDVILEKLSSFSKLPKKKMYVLHLMGSHFDYKQRYIHAMALYKNETSIIQEYDNSIYFTDYILKKIYEKFKNEKVLIVYISDHGEVVDLKKNGHGFLPPYKDEFNVPFIVYSSVKNVRLDEIYEDNKKGYFNLESLNRIIEYITGISNDKNFSYSHNVIALDPKNIFNYDQLKMYKSK